MHILECKLHIVFCRWVRLLYQTHTQPNPLAWTTLDPATSSDHFNHYQLVNQWIMQYTQQNSKKTKQKPLMLVEYMYHVQL